MYPAFVFTFAVVVMIAVVAFIVPVFVGIFEEISSETPGESAALPLMTQITVGISDSITGSWYIVIPVLAVLAFLFLRWKKTERGRCQWDAFKLRLPMKIGDVVQKVALARWSRTFSGTISSGVPILQAIKIAGETAGNEVVAEAMDDVYVSVRRAARSPSPLGRSASSRPWSPTWSRSARRPASSSTMLEKVADFYEAEVDAKVKALTSLIEPVMIIFVGAVVGFIVISMYLPIFSLYDKIR